MPEKETLERARRDKRQGKPATTQAGEFVREEMHHASEGKHPVKSRKQAIAIGLSKARRAGIKLPPQSTQRVLYFGIRDCARTAVPRGAQYRRVGM